MLGIKLGTVFNGGESEKPYYSDTTKFIYNPVYEATGKVFKIYRGIYFYDRFDDNIIDHIEVDWGDGTAISKYYKKPSNPDSKFGSMNHTFKSRENIDYVITIKTIVKPGFEKVNILECPYILCIHTIPQIRRNVGLRIKKVLSIDSRFKNYQMFYSNCTVLDSKNMIFDVFKNSTNMNRTFQNCTSLEKMIPWPKSVRNVAYCYDGCTSLKLFSDTASSAILMPNYITNYFDAVFNTTPEVMNKFKVGWGGNILDRSNGYCLDHLIYMFDAEDNMGYGKHSDDTAVWKNLAGDNDAICTNEAKKPGRFKDKYFDVSNEGFIIKDKNIAKMIARTYSFTIEVVFRNKNNKNAQSAITAYRRQNSSDIKILDFYTYNGYYNIQTKYRLLDGWNNGEPDRYTKLDSVVSYASNVCGQNQWYFGRLDYLITTGFSNPEESTDENENVYLGCKLNYGSLAFSDIELYSVRIYDSGEPNNNNYYNSVSKHNFRIDKLRFNANVPMQ